MVQSIPADVPILLAPSTGRDALLHLLHAKKVLDKKRVVDWKSDTVYAADTVPTPNAPTETCLLPPPLFFWCPERTAKALG
jgi:hypothetical protein